jgi:hypothetical protein
MANQSIFKLQVKSIGYREKELVGHGTLTHPDGFGSPVGKLEASTHYQT